jgi:hypothetical protein
VLLTFAFHFCFTRTSSAYEVIDQFVDVFARLRAYLDSFIDEHLRDLYDPARAAAVTVTLQSYVASFATPIPEVLQRAVAAKDAGEAEWIQMLARRIVDALRPAERLKVRISPFNALVEWFALLGSDEVREAIPIWRTADGWRPMLRLARRADPVRPLFAAFLQSPQPLPVKLLQDIADWPADAPRPGDAALARFVRPAIAQWLAGEPEADARDRVLAGLWRVSAL